MMVTAFNPLVNINLSTCLLRIELHCGEVTCLCRNLHFCLVHETPLAISSWLQVLFSTLVFFWFFQLFACLTALCILDLPSEVMLGWHAFKVTSSKANFLHSMVHWSQGCWRRCTHVTCGFNFISTFDEILITTTQQISKIILKSCGAGIVGRYFWWGR